VAQQRGEPVNYHIDRMSMRRVQRFHTCVAGPSGGGGGSKETERGEDGEEGKLHCECSSVRLNWRLGNDLARVLYVEVELVSYICRGTGGRDEVI